MSKNYLSDFFRKILWNVKYFAPKARDFFLEWAIHFIKEGYMVTEITENFGLLDSFLPFINVLYLLSSRRKRPNSEISSCVTVKICK